MIEALCEVYFGDSSWDDTVPGVFYERVKEDFPIKEQRDVQEARITLGPGQASAGVRSLSRRIQFVSRDRDRMIQLEENLLVVNQLQPYAKFEVWEPVIHQALRIYKELVQPKKLARVGLRYINRVVISEAQVQMEDYFSIYPKLPVGLGDTHSAFLVRVEVPQREKGHTVLITFGSQPSPNAAMPVQQSFMLDLYDQILIDESIDKADLSQIITQAHENVVVAFEDSITDQLRELFEPEVVS